jgi:hypothetical protein
MQLLNLELEHLNLFCPATGEEILSPEDVNESAKSLKAYWVDEVMYEPFIKDEALEQAWKVFIEKYEEEHDDLPDSGEIEDFLVNYPEPNWVIYKITTCGMACGPVWSTVWNIIDMNTVNEA